MVEEVIKYRCGFPNCEELYDSETEAQKCEDQGHIGPYIDSGLTLGGQYSGYLILLSTSAHNKQYSFLNIPDSLDDMKIEESPSQIPKARVEEHGISSIERFVKDGIIQFMDEPEFKEISDVIQHGQNLWSVRETLRENGVKELYRTHPSLSALQVP
tara:strand:+ start:1483 stop:1953 length:471 start_codon:yes stop_codon:yes gene_type:complete